MEELYSPGEKIGEFLIKIGALTKEKVAEILEKQEKDPSKLFGEIALELGYIDDKAIDKYLASQSE